MSTIASRKNKGRTLQKYCRDMILARFPLLPGDVMSTPMGVSGPDVYLSPKAKEMYNDLVSCKNDEHRSIWHCWDATLKIKNDGTYDKYLLIMKKNHRSPLAVLDYGDYMGMYKELFELRQQLKLLQLSN